MTLVVKQSVKRVAWLLSLVLSLLLIACSERPVHHFKISGFTMGTSYHVTVVDPQQQYQAEVLKTQIDGLLEQVNQQMSNYLDDSELSMLNRVPNALPFEVASPLFDLLLQAMEIAWLSNGAFDVTVGPLVNLWGFGPKAGDERIPTQQEITVAMENVGYQHLVLDLADTTVQKTRPVTVDLSAIAKGYGVDKVAELLGNAGLDNFMVEIGGELYLAGTNPYGKPWRIAIEQPGSSIAQVHRTLKISNAALATSGDYRNYFEVDGQRYSHTIDPRTGLPVTHNLVSATVVAADCAYADALATAISVMGVEEGLRLAEEQDLAVYLISRSEAGFEVNYSDAFTAYLD